MWKVWVGVFLVAANLFLKFVLDVRTTQTTLGLLVGIGLVLFGAAQNSKGDNGVAQRGSPSADDKVEQQVAERTRKP